MSAPNPGPVHRRQDWHLRLLQSFSELRPFAGARPRGAVRSHVWCAILFSSRRPSTISPSLTGSGRARLIMPHAAMRLAKPMSILPRWRHTARQPPAAGCPTGDAVSHEGAGAAHRQRECGSISAHLGAELGATKSEFAKPPGVTTPNHHHLCREAANIWSPNRFDHCVGVRAIRADP